MISDAQRKVLVAHVLRFLPVNVSVDEVGHWIGPVLASQVEMQSRTAKLAEWMVDQALAAATMEPFLTTIDRLRPLQSGTLDAIITLADELRNGTVDWKPRVAAMAVSWALGADPLMTRDGLPFVDRSEFRKLLPRPEQQQELPHCLIVSGNEKTGKTFLSEFCLAYAQSRGGMNVGYSRLSGPPIRATPRSIAQSLAVGLKANPRARPLPLAHEEAERDAKNLASWICLTTPENDLPSIAIIDGFDKPGLPEAVHIFVGELARHIDTNEMVRARLRLILTGYDASRLLRYGVDPPIHVLESIDKAHLAEWFRLSFPDQPDYLFEQVAERIMANLEAYQPHERLETLNYEVLAATAEFGR